MHYLLITLFLSPQTFFQMHEEDGLFSSSDQLEHLALVNTAFHLFALKTIYKPI